MNHLKVLSRRTSPLTVLMILIAVLFVVARTTGQEQPNDKESVATEQWEYLAVAGPSTTNFTPSGNPRMRKEPNAGFGREAFVLEQHLDKLGANGWDLVAVAGPPTDPVFYFKRRK